MDQVYIKGRNGLDVMRERELDGRHEETRSRRDGVIALSMIHDV